MVLFLKNSIRKCSLTSIHSLCNFVPFNFTSFVPSLQHSSVDFLLLKPLVTFFSSSSLSSSPLNYGRSYLPSHRSCDLTIQKIGEKVSLLGWVESIRKSSKQLYFLPLRDTHGKIQTIVHPPYVTEFEPILQQLTPESVVYIQGTLLERPLQGKKQTMEVKNEKQNDEVEVQVEHLELLNKADTIPFSVNADPLPNEEFRLKHRYLDLRRPSLHHNLKVRSNSIQFFRTFFHQHGFLEIETPLLFKSTPEGAREYLVLTRTPSYVYALPQSPQQYKQLLMVSGVDKYFQIAKCFRDEDQRKDRQPEFTQLDIEMQGVNMLDLIHLIEQMLFQWCEHQFQINLHSYYPTDHFPRLTYQEAMTLYQTDKPDLRSNSSITSSSSSIPLAFVWITHFPLFETKNNQLQSTHHPFTAPSDLDVFHTHPDQVTGLHFDLVLNGMEIGGGSIRIYQPELQEKVFQLLNISHTPFQHWLKAMKYGCPPHGGLALGLDRLLSILLNTDSIRDVIAFPKTQGVDLMVQAPSPVTAPVLKEYGLSFGSNIRNSTPNKEREI